MKDILKRHTDRLLSSTLVLVLVVVVVVVHLFAPTGPG